jgi:hypothetical protein
MRKEIRERIARTEAGRRAFDLSPQEASEWMENSNNHPEPEGPFGWRSRAWHADQYHWRMETEVPGDCRSVGHLAAGWCGNAA